MDESASSPSAPAPAPVARSIGERLRAGRDRSGLSVLAAAEKLHLDPKVIEALEADRFAELGASVYVRGHLKRYAEFVGETALELVNMYNARDARPSPPDLTQVPHPERRADPRRLVTPAVVLGCAGALLVAIWWVLAGSHPDAATPGAAAPVTPVVPGDAAPVTSPSATVNATPASMTAVLPAPTPASLPPASGTAPAASTEAAAPPSREQPAQVRETSLRLELTGDSWVEVYDSRGERLFFDVASAGSVQSITGRAPLRVVLENAGGVAVEVDGQPRQIPASAVDGERARFIVNRSGSLSRAR
jgi:cytoskeleton protein RodZ